FGFREKDFKISELEECVRNKDLEIEKSLERLNVCENKLHKMGQINQTVHMIMPSKGNLYNGKKGIGFENLSYFEKAKDLRLTLYDEKQTSSLKPYVPNVILEKIIINLEVEVVNLLEKEKVNLETIESLKSKSFWSSENVCSKSENKSESDCLVVEEECDKEKNQKVIAPGMFKLNVSQCVSSISMSKSLYLDTISSVRRPKNSGVIWKKKGSSNTSNVGLSAVSVSKLNKNVKRYSRKDLLACYNSHLGETRSNFVCNDTMNVSCVSRMNDLLDDNNFFIFDDVNVRISHVSKMPFRKKPRDSMHARSKSNLNKSLPTTVHKWLHKLQPLAEPVAKWFPRVMHEASKVIISFIMKTQVNLQLQVQRVRTDNGTEFKNKTLAKFFDEGSDQIQTPQYPEIHPPSNEISDEVFQEKGDLMKSIQTFLEEFNYIPFEEKPPILLQAWFNFFTIQRAQPEDSKELFHKLLKDLKELEEYKESLEKISNEIASSSSNQENEGPSQDSDIHQLIREECCVEVCKEQKQNMENAILELVEICRQKELLCIHENEVKNVVEQPAERRTRVEKSLQNFRVIHFSLNNTSQISPVHAVAPISSTEEPEYSLSMGYEHLSITRETESDEVTKFNAKNLLPIPSEYEEAIHRIENLLYDNSSSQPPEEHNAEEERIKREHAEYISRMEMLFIINPRPHPILNANTIIESLSSLHIPVQDGDSQREEIDIVTKTDDVLPPSIENDDDSEWEIDVVEELLSDNSIPFTEDEASYSDHQDDPSFPRPPPKPPDAEFDFEPDAEEEIPVVMNEKDEFDVSNDENDDYFPFIVRTPSLTLISPFRNSGFTPHRLKFLVLGYLSRFTRSSHPLIEISLEKSISFDQYCLAIICRLYA
nr:hypothetical protein [Tanacetum cinerariifolium]